MVKTQTQQIILAKRPNGMPKESDFEFKTTDLPSLTEGDVLLETQYVSVDPYMRGRMSDQKSYIAPFELGAVISGGVIAKVIETKSENFVKGDVVLGQLGWQTYHVVSDQRIRKIDPTLAPVTTYLGILGMPGLTAYFGLLDIGQPKEDETVVISGAAGAVGSVVGQIAKIKGARVIGIAGKDEKLKYLKDDLKFDAVVNYQSASFVDDLKNACTNGVDVYFDNVGGEVSDAVIQHLNKGSRIPICGQISLYNLTKADTGPRIQSHLLIKSAMMKGFIVSDYSSQFKEGVTQLGQWLAEGKLNYRETITDGFKNIPKAFIGLFHGDNIGKYLVRI